MGRRSLLLGSLVLTIGMLISGGFATAGREGDLTQINDEGAVEITVTYLNPKEKVEGGKLAFDVSMSTHSVNLDRYRMEELTFLRDEKGNRYKALGWFSSEGGGHHRSGVVKFSNKNSSGKPIVDSKTKFVEVIIKGVDGVAERVFRWEFKR